MSSPNESVIHIVSLLLDKTGQGSIKGFVVKREVNSWLHKHPDTSREILNEIREFFLKNGPW